ncbi:MAG TPA: AMP-binding protein [Kofleriaceae bacterium]|nr:AMP-binding protein [Kofleriaceae bacterium]
MDGPGQILPRAARRFGDRIALVTAGRTLRYRELDEESDRVASALRARGLEPGQVVSLYAQNRWEWVVSYHGALKAGAIVNPVNVMLTTDELAYVLRDCGSAALFASGDKIAGALRAKQDLPALRTIVAFDELPDTATTPGSGVLDFGALLASGRPGAADVAAPDPRSPCTIGYTSGTTGYPKGAVQSHQAVLLNCALTATMHGRSERDVVVTALPAPHVYGNVVINGTFLVGGTVVLMERFAPAAALALIAEHRATMFEGVPAMYAAMLVDPALASRDLRSLTRCTVGGQTIAVPVIERWERASGAPLIELWGMTELAGLGTTHALHAPPVPGSIGVALPGIEVRVADLEDRRRTAAPGVPGELVVRGPIVMNGYHGNAAATAEAIDPDGWLHTGDLAYASADGHFFVIDRLKDMIITAGYNIYPAEIERVLVEHPAVAAVAAAAVPDAMKGELACAYIVLRPGASATEQDLIAFTEDRLAAYKRPRLVRFVADLPKTSSGKIMRRELIKLFTP